MKRADSSLLKRVDLNLEQICVCEIIKRFDREIQDVADSNAVFVSCDAIKPFHVTYFSLGLRKPFDSAEAVLIRKSVRCAMAASLVLVPRAGFIDVGDHLCRLADVQ